MRNSCLSSKWLLSVLGCKFSFRTPCESQHWLLPILAFQIAICRPCEFLVSLVKNCSLSLPLRISLPPCGLFIVSPRASVLVPPSVHMPPLPLASHSSIPLPFNTTLRARTQGPFLHFHMARTRGALVAPSHCRTPRQRASSARVPRDLPPQEATKKAPQIPLSEGGTPASPSSSAPQHMYETRRPATTQGATASRP